MGSWGISNHHKPLSGKHSSFQTRMREAPGWRQWSTVSESPTGTTAAPLLAAASLNHQSKLAYPVPSRTPAHGHGHYVLSRTLGPYLLPVTVGSAHQTPWDPGGGGVRTLQSPLRQSPPGHTHDGHGVKDRKVGNTGQLAWGRGDWHPVGTLLAELGRERGEGSPVISADPWPGRWFSSCCE